MDFSEISNCKQRAVGDMQIKFYIKSNLWIDRISQILFICPFWSEINQKGLRKWQFLRFYVKPILAHETAIF